VFTPFQGLYAFYILALVGFVIAYERIYTKIIKAIEAGEEVSIEYVNL